MAYSASVADLLAFDAWLDSLPELDRASMERAIKHYHGGRHTEAFDSNDLRAAEARGYARGKQDGKTAAMKELGARKN